MFERFTDRARRVVVLAQDEALHAGHGYIGQEHLLIGLLAEGESLAYQSLTDCGVGIDAARAHVAELTADEETAPRNGHIPLTPRAKNVFEIALREALQLGVSYIACEHFLLGMIRQGEGRGVETLIAVGPRLSDIRSDVIHKLAGTAGPPPATLKSNDEPEDRVEAWIHTYSAMPDLTSGKSIREMARHFVNQGWAISYTPPQLEPDDEWIANGPHIDVIDRSTLADIRSNKRMFEAVDPMTESDGCIACGGNGTALFPHSSDCPWLGIHPSPDTNHRTGLDPMSAYPTVITEGRYGHAEWLAYPSWWLSIQYHPTQGGDDEAYDFTDDTADIRNRLMGRGDTPDLALADMNARIATEAATDPQWDVTLDDCHRDTFEGWHWVKT